MNVSRLFRPLDYLRIRHEAKFKYDFGIPISIAIFFTLLASISPAPINIFGNDGLVKIVSGLIGILAGFFIASLAAIATFNNSGMDRVMPGEPPVLDVTVRGHKEELKLTRRRFLSLLFGYLSMLSIFLYLFGEVSRVLAPSVVDIVGLKFIFSIRIIFIFAYTFVLSNLLVTTFLGLFFMSDRIHRSDSEIKSLPGLPPMEPEESTSDTVDYKKD